MSKYYRDLIAWQKAMELVKGVYRVTKQFPEDERFGLTSQVRRAAVSIPSNIAEGQGRLTSGEFKQFLGHARGSLFETETQLLLATDFEYLASNDTDLLLNQSSELSRVLNGLIQSLH